MVFSVQSEDLVSFCLLRRLPFEQVSLDPLILHPPTSTQRNSALGSVLRFTRRKCTTVLAAGQCMR